jgi:hypothetical protein
VLIQVQTNTYLLIYILRDRSGRTMFVDIVSPVPDEKEEHKESKNSFRIEDERRGQWNNTWTAISLRF